MRKDNVLPCQILDADDFQHLAPEPKNVCRKGWDILMCAIQDHVLKTHEAVSHGGHQYPSPQSATATKSPALSTATFATVRASLAAVWPKRAPHDVAHLRIIGLPQHDLIGSVHVTDAVGRRAISVLY